LNCKQNQDEETGMRVHPDYAAQQVQENNRTQGQSSPAPGLTAGSSANLGEDQALLSGAHTQVQALAAQASQLPEAREDRVQTLRQAVESGEYNPSPENVAGAIFSQLLVGQAA